MSDQQTLANQVAIMSALVEIAHAVAHGGQVSAGTIEALRNCVRDSERRIAEIGRAPPYSNEILKQHWNYVPSVWLSPLDIGPVRVSAAAPGDENAG